MNSHHDGNDIDRSLPGENTVPLLHGPLTQAEQAANNERRERQAEKQAEAAYKQRQLALAESANRATWTNIVLTLVLALFTAIGAWAAWYQGRIAKLNAVASQEAADAAKSAADTATASLKEQQKNEASSGEQFKTQLSKLDASLRESARLANATNAFAVQAQRSADYAKQSIDTAVDSERPWIGVGSFTAEDFVEGKTAKLRLTYVNSGKRPATASIIYGGGPQTRFTPFSSVSYQRPPSVSFLLPGASSNGVSEFDIPEHAFADWKKGHQTFYFMAEIIYTDVGTNIGHITHFCTYYDPANKNLIWPLCSGYNEAR